MVKLFTSLLGGAWLYLAAGVVGAALSAGVTYYVVSEPYKLTISSMETASAKADAASEKANNANLSASLAQFVSDTAAINDAATALVAVQDRVSTQFTSISKDFADVVKAHPLPADCKPDANRMLTLTAAVRDANAAAISGATGPGPGSGLPANK